MLLKVKLLKGGREETVEVRDDTVRVEELKQILAGVFGIPPGEQSLVYKGKALLAPHCLRDYSISDGAKLFLAHKPPTITAGSGPQQLLRESGSADGSSRGDTAALAGGSEGRSEEGRVVLTVKLLKGGREEKIEVESDQVSILDIKKILEGRCGVPTSQQSLVVGGRALSDSQRLCDCSITSGTTLFLAQKTAPPTPTPPPAPIPAVWTHHTDFWPRLRQFLLKHFSPEDAEKILSNMEEELRRCVYDVNLDTIESLAGQILLQQQHL